MTRVNIPLPDALHKRLRIKAATEGKTLKELVIGILEERA